MKKKQFLSWVLSICAASILFSACKKTVEMPEPDPEPSKKSLNVVLHPYVQPGEVDSAIAKWFVNGKENVVRLTLRNDTLLSDIREFQQGSGRMTIQVFSSKKLDNKSLQFERVAELDIQHKSNVRIDGPQGLQDVNWKPRVIFYVRESVNFNITAIIGIRPADPYFELKEIDPAWRHRITIERNYFQQGAPHTKIAGGTWDCQSNCLDADGNYTNKTYFAFLPQQINNRNWSRVEFIVRFYKAYNYAGEANFDHNF